MRKGGLEMALKRIDCAHGCGSGSSRKHWWLLNFLSDAYRR
jgi:hypothetical protein